MFLALIVLASAIASALALGSLPCASLDSIERAPTPADRARALRAAR